MQSNNILILNLLQQFASSDPSSQFSEYPSHTYVGCKHLLLLSQRNPLHPEPKYYKYTLCNSLLVKYIFDISGFV